MASWIRSGVVTAALACAALQATPTWAQEALHGDPVHGKAISYTCLGCHGIPGYRNAFPNYSVPKLEGQHPEYIVAALQAYKNGERSHMTMHSQAASLSEQDMADIAVFFAGKALQASAPAAAANHPPAAAALCVACHGADGVGVVPQYPTLAGQHQDYLVRELAEYKNGGRRNAVMAGMANQVKDADADAIAAYYSSLKPSLQTLERPLTFLSSTH